MLKASYFRDDDVLALSENLIGKKIVTQWEGGRTSGIIVETEAYKAPVDKASHAYNNKKTARTSTMFEAGGILYVYLCYGLHHLLNIVTGPKDVPHAILIRAIEPVEGIRLMCERRGLIKPERNLTAGPALVSQALGLHCGHDGLPLKKPQVWVESFKEIPSHEILKSPRVGVAYAQEYAQKPWRFRLKDSSWTSPAK